MNAVLRRNLKRLFQPRHVAVVGGDDAAIVCGECDRIGFSGPVWPVNARRDSIAGRSCFACIADLPQPPDATFIAIPRDGAIDVVAELQAAGAGGAVVYSAGFAEIGGQGVIREQQLIEAAGDLALVGPNCYGVINFIHKVALWPFAHSGFTPGYGAAVITQSGMLSSDLLMAQRSVPMAYMVSAGNQSRIGIEDFIDVFIDDDKVRAIGVHIEGVRDVNRFAAVATRAVRASKPIVALKTGSSAIGSSLTVSHTGSLSGADDLYTALFEQTGVIRVDSPSQLLETLKWCCVADLPKGRRLAGFTCSGGGATLLADYAEHVQLEFAQPDSDSASRLRDLLPYTATVSNPLDYTTPLWGDSRRLPPVLTELVSNTTDAAVMVQDYPLPDMDESKPYYLNDAQSFASVVTQAKIPGAICSTLPENIDKQTREWLVEQGVAPMQGIHECLNAIAASAQFGEQQQIIIESSSESPDLGVVDAYEWSPEDITVIAEAVGKSQLRAGGVNVPIGDVVDCHELSLVAERIGFPVALKWASDVYAHKSEVGAVAVGLDNALQLELAAKQMCEQLAGADQMPRFLLERAEPKPVVEMLVSVRQDPVFGWVLTLGAGGTLSELLADVANIILPASRGVLHKALNKLKIARLLHGYRGNSAVDLDCLIDSIRTITRFACDNAHWVNELEINPLFVYADRTCAVDVLISGRQPEAI